MARVTNGELAAQVAELLAENERLRAAVEAEAARADSAMAYGAQAGVVVPDAAPPRAGRRRGRAVASAVLVVIGLLLMPVSLVANWAGTQLADTEAFVSTFAPLAADPAVKAFVVDEVMTAIDQQVDFEGTTAQVFDAVGDLGLPPAAGAALDALKTPAALGLRSLATGVVTQFVDSDAFRSVWEQSLRLSHQQLVAALTGDPGSALAISSSGELSVQLGPIIQAVKTEMVAQGLGFAEAIPAVDVSIVVAQSDSFGQLTLGYALAVGLGAWLPWVALAFLVVGVALARRRTVAVLRTGLALGIVMVLLGIALRIGGLVTVATIAPRYLPIDAAGAIYDGVTRPLGGTVLALAVLAFTVALIAWVLGPFRPAPALRAVFAETVARLRRHGDTAGA